jgi:hypothetical protein
VASSVKWDDSTYLLAFFTDKKNECKASWLFLKSQSLLLPHSHSSLFPKIAMPRKRKPDFSCFPGCLLESCSTSRTFPVLVQGRLLISK